MFKKSRRRIVFAIMSILVFLFIGALAVIYASSYFEVSKRNYEMLEKHTQMYKLPESVEGDSIKDMPHGFMEPFQNEPPRGNPFEDTPSFKLATFYSVALSQDEQILATDIGENQLYDEVTLQKYAKEILKSNSERGIKDNLIYLVSKKNSYTLVAFMDNTLMRESMTTLFRYTLVFGGLVLITLFFIALYLAKRIVKPLEESYLKQKQFISDAGHELKTPVAVVTANADLLAREIGENQWLANIQYENERMGKLVGQLLELARTENIKMQTECLEFSRLVEGETLPFESIAFDKGILLKTEIAENIYVMGNSTQLSQLVSILVDNAIRHSNKGKEITVKLIDNRNSTNLSVINAGEPIAPEKIEHLFERFYRADEARSGDDNHYGLGLAIAKAIVTAHKGKIDVKCYEGLVEFKVTLQKV